jgi:hypothetical protein
MIQCCGFFYVPFIEKRPVVSAGENKKRKVLYYFRMIDQIITPLCRNWGEGQ